MIHNYNRLQDGHFFTLHLTEEFFSGPRLAPLPPLQSLPQFHDPNDPGSAFSHLASPFPFPSCGGTPGQFHSPAPTMAATGEGMPLSTCVFFKKGEIQVILD